ncbi:hypothetical protein RF11_03822 [Thelohanellus kitauei]|uniref:Uncharacterized protein n=1 Tax=Thelohanellus kitauei TaxID=669202 RepID=A0A0C2IU21_THEKT|nr:hypothetical protein RF11_03822 [Thelohanellus kitauei]
MVEKVFYMMILEQESLENFLMDHDFDVNVRWRMKKRNIAGIYVAKILSQGSFNPLERGILKIEIARHDNYKLGERIETLVTGETPIPAIKVQIDELLLRGKRQLRKGECVRGAKIFPWQIRKNGLE